MYFTEVYFGCFAFSFFLLTLSLSSDANVMSRNERLELREEARDMFYHAYWAYMENAYPADELMPLSCSGRYRGLTPNRGDIDDSLGNFSLTLIDTLDTLVILGDLEEFEHAVKLVIDNVSFDNDVIVSVFETNIRILGGLLSAHVLADYLQQRDGIMQWYKSELLDMAKDVGYRLLPAFNTTTGIPYSRVNLKHGIKGERLETSRETCTACAGSVILEMAALSRLTGEPIFEEKAHRAMDELWKMRHRSSDLMGTILNVHSGDWVRRDSGVGAGIDSYYEYCLKAYILLGDDRYLNRFNRHYNAVMKYISQGPMLLDVHMHRPHTNSRNYMDALLAFWPGLQVLKGDLKPAVETHEMLYQVMQRHKFIPEAFTTDFQVHWGNHPLRPEFLESTYFLHMATGDPYYLEVGKYVLKSLQKYARVPCGYAAVNDVRTGKQEDRMDSFVLAETFKYLYLLFADKEDVILNLDEFVFTTEGHLLPLTLGVHHNISQNDLEGVWEESENEFARACPNTLQLFPESVRKPLQNMVDGMCPRRISNRRLTGLEFSHLNFEHLKIIKEMGIDIITTEDGFQVVHTYNTARSPNDAEEGIVLMQELLDFKKVKPQDLEPQLPAQAVSFYAKDNDGNARKMSVKAGPAHFGTLLTGNKKVTAQSVIVQPFKGCTDLNAPSEIIGKIALVERGDCVFVDKARRVEKAGAVGVIIIDNASGSSASANHMFSMSGDDTSDVVIPTVFLFAEDASKLLHALSSDPNVEVTLSEYKTDEGFFQSKEDESDFDQLKLSVQEFLNKHTGIALPEIVKVGGFTAFLSVGKIKIIYEAVEEEFIPTERVTNQQWSKSRKELLHSLFNSKAKELFVSLRILHAYYHGLSNSKDNVKSTDIVKQTEWLLTELNVEYHRKEDDVLIKAEKSTGVTVFAGDSAGKDSVEYKESLQKLNSVVEAINKIEKNLISDMRKTSNKKENTDKVVIKKEQIDISEVQGVDNRKTKKSRVSDEL